MTKFFTAALAAIAVSASAMAATFHVPPNATVTGSPDGTISWSGVSIGSVVHFRDTNSAPVEYKVGGATTGSVKLQEVASYGGRFQLIDGNGNWAYLSPQGARFNAVGIRVECSHPDGCALEIDLKARPVPAAAVAPTGVYYGQPATQQVAAVPVVAYQAQAVPAAVVAPAPPAQQRIQQPGYEWKLVPTAPAPTVVVTPPVKKVVVAKKVDDGCVAGKPIETKDGTIQCIPKVLTRIGDAPKPVEAAPATPPAASAPATAPAAPAAKEPAAGPTAPPAATAAPAVKKG